MPVPATHCSLVDLTLGDEDANSKVDVVTDVEVDVGESKPIFMVFIHKEPGARNIC